MWPFRRKKAKAQPVVTMTISEGRIQSNEWAAYQARLDGPNTRMIRKHLELTNELQEAPASKQFELAQRMLKSSEKVAKAFQEDGWKDMPTHLGFRRIAINLERQGDFEGAISACQEAKRQGWSGDWDKRIERCHGKLAKNAGR
jgi:hypothetical protein